MPDPSRLPATIQRVREFGARPHRVDALRDGGVTRGQVRAAVDAGALLVLRRGIVIPTGLWDAGDVVDRRRWAATAALLAFPGACASHETAARLHGLPDFRLTQDRANAVPTTHISRMGAARTEDWLVVHGCRTPPEWVADAGGIPVTDLVRTSIETAAGRSFRGALVIVDAAMRLAAVELAGPRGLREAVIDPAVVSALRLRWRVAVGAYARHRWVTTVRRAVELADPAAETVLESLSRAAMIEHDLPLPRCGVPLPGDDGRTYWADFYWDAAGLIGEADGLVKYVDAAVLLREKQRQEALSGRHAFVRWGFGHVYPDPTVMVGRLRHALSQPPTRPRWS